MHVKHFENWTEPNEWLRLKSGPEQRLYLGKLRVKTNANLNPNPI